MPVDGCARREGVIGGCSNTPRPPETWGKAMGKVNAQGKCAMVRKSVEGPRRNFVLVSAVHPGPRYTREPGIPKRLVFPGPDFTREPGTPGSRVHLRPDDEDLTRVKFDHGNRLQKHRLWKENGEARKRRP